MLKNNFFHFLRGVLTLTLLLTCTATQVYASSSETSDNLRYITIIDGSTYEFDSYHSYLKYLEDNSNHPGVSLYTSGGTDYRSTLLWSETKNYSWIGYHSLTPNWATASAYHLTATSTYSASGSVQSHGYTIGVTVQYQQSVSTDIPADPSKYSKLGVYADVKVSRYKYDVYEYGTYSYTYYVNSAVPLQRYITAVYR